MGVKLSEKDGKLYAEGIAPPKWIAEFEERAPWIAGVNAIDESHLQNSDLVELERLKGEIESAVLLFPLGRAELESGQEGTLAQATKNIQSILVDAQGLHGTISFEVVGHSDSTGVEATNLPLSRQRADLILLYLHRAGIKSANLRPRGVGTSQPLRNEETEEGRRLNRSVTFKVAFSPASPVN